MINLCPSEGQRQEADNGNIRATGLVEPDSGDASLTVRWTLFLSPLAQSTARGKGNTCGFTPILGNYNYFYFLAVSRRG